MAFPDLASRSVERGSFLLNISRKVTCTNPEQSMPALLRPPSLYGVFFQAE